MKHNFYFLTFLLVLTAPIYAQSWEKKGHQQFQEMAYSKAIFSLEKALEKGVGNAKIYRELADSYYFNANYNAACKWYANFFKKPLDPFPIHYFRFAQSLKSAGKYKEAIQVLQQLAERYPNEINANLLFSAKEFNVDKIKNSGRFAIELAFFNTSSSDFGTSYFGNELVFASSRETNSLVKLEHSWTNQPFTNLYTVNPDSILNKPRAFNKNINSKLNESTAVFTQDGTTMYFTRNNFVEKKIGSSHENTMLLKIFKAVRTKNEWVVSGALPFCSHNYNFAHPSLSTDEKTLYFSSNMPGGFGQSDLYKVAINSDGSFGNPENLGKTVNTFGRESFPFVSKDNQLYFASDGYDGFGGLDIYVANLDENDAYTWIQNVGEPVNSSLDDFGFIINSETKKGFFSSNRPNGIGLDDIYIFQELITLPCQSILKGSIIKEGNDIPIHEIEISLLDANLNQLTTTKSDEMGKYEFLVDCKKKYVIRVVSKGYVTQEIRVETKQNPATFTSPIDLKKEVQKFKLGEDLAKKLELLPLYFDLSKYDIRPDAALELEKIKRILLENPTIEIEIRSHTDSRDSAQKNKNLSENRTKATIKWLVTNGIDSSRLSGSGYGESLLLNKCKDGILCSEMEHQLNRRSEFIVTKL